MSSNQGDIMVGNVKNLVDRLSKDFSASKPPLSVHEPRKPLIPKQPLFNCVATFSYTATQDDELSLEVGDIIEVLEEVEDGWNRGRIQKNGRVGVFPTNFVEVKATPSAIPKEKDEVVKRTSQPFDDRPEAIKRTPSVLGAPTVTTFAAKEIRVDTKDEQPKMKEMARVKFIYEPNHPDELRLGEIGQMITIIQKDCGDAGWFEGELNGRRGLFPDNFVEIVQVPIHTDSSNRSQSSFNATNTSNSGGTRIAKAPMAAPVSNVAPPTVPAKPIKQKLSSEFNYPPPNSTSTTPSTTTTPAPAVSSTKPIVSSNFAALRDNLQRGLKVLPPDQVPMRTTATERGYDEENEEVGQLSHITKDRPRPPGKRPASMMMLKKKNSTENLLDSGDGSSHPTNGNTNVMSTSAFNIPSSISPVTSSSATSKQSTNPLYNKEELRPLNKEDKSPGFGGAKHHHHPLSVSPSESEYVTRREYNDLLARFTLLEARLAQLEKR